MNLYRPSNGTEGMGFTDEYCMQCLHCDPDPDGEKQCDIMMRSFCYNTNEPEYPTEWCYVYDKPTCTNWQKWDWGNDDNRTPPPEPEPIEPSDPSQLMMPFGFADLFKGMDNVVVTKDVITSVEVLRELS
jgi:hypothetical protein